MSLNGAGAVQQDLLSLVKSSVSLSGWSDLTTVC